MGLQVSAQQKDSITSRQLKEVLIRAWTRKDISRLPQVYNLMNLAGKKTELIQMSGLHANVAIKTSRQVFAKIPGVFVYDMDGSGNQVNIATRGLDPHRSWEYNNRQNGILINSDMYGYPASHYSAPMESYENIELIRGTGSLQYGAQFGGMINYVTKKPDSTKLLNFESINTAGSFNLLSTYNAISGTYKKFSYYAYYHRRHSDGYRKSNESDANAQFVQLNYQLTDKLKIRGEFGRSTYLHRMPGPLNDSMFREDPTISTRDRNYFSPDIYVPSVSLHYQANKDLNMQLTASGLYGTRNSVLYDAFANIKDSINPNTLQYKNRQVDIDNFHSRTIEFRMMKIYSIGKFSSNLSAGFNYMNNDLHRRQLGKGTTGSDYNMDLAEPGFGRDLHFLSQNIAVFAENAFHIGKQLIVSPGVRFEQGQSTMEGNISYYPSNQVPNKIKHKFLLPGIGLQWNLSEENNFYAGYTASYRPVIFKDIIPASVYEKIDNNLRDARGYNLEAGFRGKYKSRLTYDVNLFSLLYKNRMGTLVLQDDNGQSYTFKTNIGDSRTNGVEGFFQYKFPIGKDLLAGFFTSIAYMDARYIRGEVSIGSSNKSIRNNKVESAPEWIIRSGIEFQYQALSASILYSFTDKTYSDALNTIIPPASGARGLTPGYQLVDLNISYRTMSLLQIKAGLNNIFNHQYFTKRPAFYPGPGIWPGDGRNMYVTVGIRL